MNNSINNKIVAASSSNLSKVSKTLYVTNKILFDEIEKLFNEAFCLLNSKHLADSKVNYCFLVEYDRNFHNRKEFEFIAKEKNDYIKAIELFDNILSVKYNHIYSLVCRGICKRATTDFEGAMADYLKAVQFDKNCAFAYYLIGNIEFILNNFDAALVAYSKAIEIDQAFTKAYRKRATLKWKLKNFIDAEIDYAKCVELDPDNLSVALFHGSIDNELSIYYIPIKNSTKALKLYKNGLDPNVWEWVEYLKRGTAHFNLGNNKDAIEDFNSALKISPNIGDAYYYRGKIKFEEQDYEGAINDYTQSLGVYNSKKCDIYNARGAAKYFLKDYEGAIENYTKAIKIKAIEIAELKKQHPSISTYDPKELNIYINRYKAYKALGKNEKANLDLENYERVARSHYANGSNI